MKKLHCQILIISLASWISALSGVSAATIEVLATYRDGAPVTEQALVLIPVSGMRQASRDREIILPFSNTETTDDEGRATFQDLYPGTYTFDVFGAPHDPLLIKPGANPAARAPLVFVKNESDQVTTVLEIWRGVPVTVETLSRTGELLPGFHASFLHVDTGFELSAGVSGESSKERLLAPGAWQVSASPGRGYLLVAVEKDGVAVPVKEWVNRSVGLDLKDQPWPTRLTFTFSAMEPLSTVDLALAEEPVPVRDEASSPLQLRVNTRRTRAAAARVEVHSLDEPGVAVRSWQIPGRQDIGVADLPAGDYLVVAAHRDAVEGRVELRPWDPRGEPRTLTVTLSEGATVRLQALDLEDRPIPGLEVRIERLGGPMQTLISDVDIIGSKLDRRQRTSYSGWIEATGFYPGRYRLRPMLSGPRQLTHAVYLGLAGGELRSELEIVLEAGPVEIEARLVPNTVEP